MYKCSQCDYSSLYKKDIIKHFNKKKKCYKEEETPEIIETFAPVHKFCKICNKKLANQNSLQKHELKCKEKDKNNSIIENLKSELEEYKEKLNEIIKGLKNQFSDFTIKQICNNDIILKNYINTEYKEYISKSKNPNYPNINLDQLTDYILNKFKNSVDIINDFEKLNNDVYENIKNIDKFNKHKLCLGYLFIKIENDSKRGKIPITVRHKLWNNHFKNSNIGKCTVCEEIINISNFHAGHIISSKNGGSDNINNLSPTCSCCNLSMGIQNLNEFKNKYF